jgi:abhydrolase domain-containing protein 12
LGSSTKQSIATCASPKAAHPDLPTMTAAEMAISFFKYASIPAAVCVGLYAMLLGLLATPTFQSHAVYLHAIQMTWFKDLNVPELFGFLRNQVTPFSIKTPDGEQLYAWHVLPVELYRKHEPSLVAEPIGLVSDVTSRLAFQLLRDDPEARLVLHMHGAGGTVGSGYRVPNYRALSAGQPGKIHVLTFDYRGFGRSTGSPSESGLIVDALAVVDWAMNVAGIPPSRILIFGQSMGTAVSIAVSKHLALQSPPVVFAGTVLVAPFADVATLAATYRVAGTLPILSPLARFPMLFNYLERFVLDKWPSKNRIARYVRANELNGKEYRLTIIHAEDDYDIPWDHTQAVFWHAVNASVPVGISRDELEQRKLDSKIDLGAAGSVMEWRTNYGVIREEILKTGLHDVVMGYPVITMAVMRSFEAADPLFTC